MIGRSPDAAKARPAPQTDQESLPIVQRLIVEAEITAERLIAWVRIAIAVSLALVFLLATEAAEYLDLIDTGGAPTGRGAMATASAFLVPGVLALLLSTPKRWRHWMAYVFAGLDSCLVCLALVRALSREGLDGAFAGAVPVAFAIPLMFAIGGLRPRPNVQLFATLSLAAGILAVVVAKSAGVEPPQGSAPSNLIRFFTFQPNMLRFAMLVATGLVIAVAMRRTRYLLNRSVKEAQRRKTLTRFLPLEIAPLVSDQRFDLMRRGQRRTATIMFVDIRDSTGRGEGLDPQRLSVFISSFRRRVMRAAIAQRGVVDKFIGDGALLLFGVLENDNDGARQAIDAASTLLALIDRWNSKRKFNPPVRVGIGIHTGEVYVGVIGDELRLEFTVLGDSVNIAARLEQLTKIVGSPLIASAATLEAAGETEGWRLVGQEPLRGRTGELQYFALADSPDWNARPPALTPAENG